jgi:outer membrane protein TolC
MAFHIARLNAYSTAFALAEQVGGDTAILRTREAHFLRVKEYVDNLKLQAQLGIIPQSDAIRGELDLGKKEYTLSQLRQLVAEERAAARKLFGFSIGQKFEIQMDTVPPSPFEDQIPESTLSAIVARAPERLQINALISQAHAQVHSAQWAWLGGCQGNQGNFGNGAGAQAFSVATGFSVNIGFGYYPRIMLAKRNVQDMINRQSEQTLELGRVLETSVGDIRELKLRKSISEANIALAERLLAEQNSLLESGNGSAAQTLQAYEAISMATVDAQTAQLGLDGHRVTLKRVALEDGFLKVYINSRCLLEGYCNKSEESETLE